MVLVPITESNVDAYVAFLMAEADEEGRAYMASVDLRGGVLRRGRNHFCLRDGQPTAALTVGRTPGPDGGLIISLRIIPTNRRTDALMACLHDFLAGETSTTAVSRLYRLSSDPDQPMPGNDLVAAGFVGQPGRYRYLRDPGPPRPGEFPRAEAALANGYATRLVPPATVTAESMVFARLADIRNRAFASPPDTRGRGEEGMRERLAAPGRGLIIAVKNDEVTGYLVFMPGEREVLIIEYASLTRHRGTGSVDAMCRHCAALVAERWGLPIVAYVDAANVPSCRAMERSGMRRVDTQPVWECRVEAGAEAPFRRP